MQSLEQVAGSGHADGRHVGQQDRLRLQISYFLRDDQGRSQRFDDLEIDRCFPQKQ